MPVPKLRFKREDGTSYPEWEEKAITDLCESIVGGGTPSTDNKAYWSGNIAWVSSSDLENNNIRHLSMTRFITEGAINNSAAKHIPCNSILIVSRVGVGKVAIAPCELCTSQDFTNLVNPVCNPIFLGYLLSLTMQKKANGVQGTSIKGVTAKEIKQYHLSIPHTEEQKKIADFLSTVDEVIAQSKAEVQNLEQQKKAAMQKIFSQEVRFKREDGTDYPEWEETDLNSIGSFYGGLSGKTKENFGKGNSKFVTYMNVYKNVFASQEMLEFVDVSDNEKQNKVQYGDLLMTQSSETVEEVGMSSVYLFRDEPYLNSFCFGLHLHNLDYTNPMYVGYLMRSKSIRKQIMSEGQGISRINLSPNRIRGIILPIPCLEEQQKIADFLSAYDEAISYAKQELDKWKELKKGLLQQMFV